MKHALMVVVAAVAAFSGEALAASGPSGWNWDKAPATAAPPTAIMPKTDPCAVALDGKVPKDCPKPQASPEADLQDALAPPKVAGPSGNNKAKKSSQ